MRKHLYFVCPTDHLETVINDHCYQENYYLTSLGNSVSFNSEFIGEINSLIEANRITEITFILSDNTSAILVQLYCYISCINSKYIATSYCSR
mgnify:CR=1 FL=1